MSFNSRTGWTAIPNKLFENKDISSDGVRLISWLISHQKGKFKVSNAGLMYFYFTDGVVESEYYMVPTEDGIIS